MQASVSYRQIKEGYYNKSLWEYASNNQYWNPGKNHNYFDLTEAVDDEKCRQ